MYTEPSSDEFIQLTQLMNDFLLAEQAPQLAALAERTPPDLQNALLKVVEPFRDYQAEHGEVEFAAQLDRRLDEWRQLIAPPVPIRVYDGNVEVEPQLPVLARGDSLRSANQELANLVEHLRGHTSTSPLGKRFWPSNQERNIFPSRLPSSQHKSIVPAISERLGSSQQSWDAMQALLQQTVAESQEMAFALPNDLSHDALPDLLEQYNSRAISALERERSLQSNPHGEPIHVSFAESQAQEPVAKAVQAFIKMEGLQEKKHRVFIERELLLSEAADQYLAEWIEQEQLSDYTRTRLKLQRALLTSCRRAGIEETIQIIDALWEFSTATSWVERKEIISRRRELLSDAADQLFALSLEQSIDDVEVSHHFNASRINFRLYRRYGIDSVFAIWALFIEGNTWEEKRRIVLEHSHLLLSDIADQILADLLAYYKGHAEATLGFKLIGTLLANCRQQGIEVTFAALAFLEAETRQEMRRIVEAQPDLLFTEMVTQSLADWLEQSEHDSHALWDLKSRLCLLSSCRRQGIDVAFAVRDFVRASTLPDRKRLIESQYDLLLSDAADQALGDWLEAFKDNTKICQDIKIQRAVLASCRSEGVEIVFQLMETIQSLLKSDSWPQRKRLIERQRDLLFSNAADQLLANLQQEFIDDAKTTYTLKSYRALLAFCRREGTEFVLQIIEILQTGENAENWAENQNTLLLLSDLFFSEAGDKLAADLLEQFKDDAEMTNELEASRASLANARRYGAQTILTVLNFVSAESWEESQRLIVANRELLLSDVADQILVEMLEEAKEHAEAMLTLKLRRTLLASCRHQKIDVAFTVWTFIFTETWEQKPTLILANRELLLGDVTAQILTHLLEQFKDYDDITYLLTFHNALLACCRREAIDAVFQIAEILWRVGYSNSWVECLPLIEARLDLLASDVADQFLAEWLEQHRDNPLATRYIKYTWTFLVYHHHEGLQVIFKMIGTIINTMQANTANANSLANSLMERFRLTLELDRLLRSESLDQLLADLLERFRDDSQITSPLETLSALLTLSRREGIDVIFKIIEAVMAFVEANSLAERKRVILKNSEMLLTDATDQFLANYIKLIEFSDDNKHVYGTLQECRSLLARCRHEGIDAAISVSATASSDELRALLAEIDELKDTRDMSRYIEACQAALALVDRTSQAEWWVLLHSTVSASLLENPPGDQANNLEQVIHHSKQVLQVLTRQAAPYGWAMTQNILAGAYSKRVLGERGENIEHAIHHAQQALLVLTPETALAEWALTMNLLATAYFFRPGEQWAENIEQAILTSNQVLLILTRQAAPAEWAMTQNLLAIAYIYRVRGERAKNIKQAIHHAQQALLVFTREATPIEWAMSQCYLASAYVNLPDGERAQNIEQAITYAQKTLLILTCEATPDQWAQTQNSLALAYLERLRGERGKNIEQAIEYLQQALNVYTRQAFPHQWAMVQHNFALAYLQRIRGERAENFEKAISHAKQALNIYTPQAFATEWVETMTNLASAYRERIRGQQAENIELAIEHFQQALQVQTRQANPMSWAMIQYNLAVTNLKIGDIEQAIFDAKQALLIFTPQAAPDRWATVQNTLANAYTKRIHGEQAENIELAIEHFQQALQVQTRQAAPYQWATIQNNLANAYTKRIPGERAENIKRAIMAYQSALEILTLEAMPHQHRQTQRTLGFLYFEGRRWAEAQSAYAAALEANDFLYQISATSEARQLELREVSDLPAHAAYCLTKLGQLEEAVTTLEQGKARALAEALTRQDAVLERATAEDKKAFTAARSRIRELEVEARAEGQEWARDFLTVSADLRLARQELSAIVARIREYLLEFMPQGLKFPYIASVVNALNQPLIYLLTTLDGSLALLVAPNQTEKERETSSVEASWLNDFQADELSSILYQENAPAYLHGTVEGKTNVLKTVLDEIWPRLNNKLRLRVATRLSELGYQQAVLIPTGTLSLLPLHALVPQVNFTVAPSARALQSALGKQKERINLPPTLLGIGNPLPNPKPLPFARIEVEEISPLFATQHTFYEKKATHEGVASHVTGATHLHFSCHGTFNLLQPLDSALYLAGDDTLTLRDLLDGGLDLSAARLAVLSACQTGIIDFQNVPDEAIGFPAGFLQAGVPGVISTLWPVNDISTALLLARFYRYHLTDGLAPATALHKAQKWLREATGAELAESCKQLSRKAHRREEKAQALGWTRYYEAQPDAKPFAHPYYWAAFTFTGV